MRIIGICGVAGSGKSTVAERLRDAHGFAVVSFADPIKHICRSVFEFSEEQLFGPSCERDRPDPRYVRADGELLTARYAAQKLGTEWARDCCPDIWLRVAFRTAERLVDTGGYAGVVIPDVRFLNEVNAIVDRRGRIIRRSGAPGIGSAHASESELLSFGDDRFDAVIPQYADKASLYAAVDDIVRQWSR